MEQYISKSALVAEIESKFQKYWKMGEESDVKRDGYGMYWGGVLSCLIEVKALINTLKVKKDEENSLEKFKELPHINSDYKIVNDWGYTPNLYHFDKSWHVTWIHCEEGDGLDDFEGKTPEEAIDKAYNWFHSTFCNS